jgi:hypothetical protein
MAKQIGQKETSIGVCRFCQGGFAKSKMTQHLKSCKARFAEMAEQDGHAQRLFHLFVEGTYRPGYWMHLEVPAAATLSDLDDFLRDTWLECCGHLSEFEIDGVSYSSQPDDGWSMGFDGPMLLSVKNLQGEEEEEESEEELEEMPSMQEMAEEMARRFSTEFHADLKDVPVEQIEKKLEQMFAEGMPGGISAETLPALRPLLSYMASSLQQGTLAEELEEAEEEMEEEGDGGMDVELDEVLNVGERFSYVYDFGSSTNLSFRVIAEREGVLPVDKSDALGEAQDEDEIAIITMARNEPPALACHVCGEPATRILPESEYDYLDEAGLCDTHAKEYDYPDELLPVVNSPRVGVCGYTGEADEEDWEDDEEDWEDEDDEDNEEE